MNNSTDNAVIAGGVAVICGLFAGFAALLASLFAFGTQNLMAVGICLGAAGLSFGFVANAAWRR